jgi:putative copper export protein/mono/diheme cytochrome c family protein/peroxiredoxin
VTSLAIGIRVAHLGASMLLVGAFAFLILVIWPASRAVKSERPTLLAHFDRLTLCLAGWSLLVMLATMLLGLWVQLATVTDQPLLEALTLADLRRILGSTQYGYVWLARFALMSLLAGFLWLREPEHDSKDWWALRLEGTALAAGIVAAQAWTGHAATGEGVTLMVQVLIDGAHLMACGVWFGGLPFLGLVLSWAKRSEDPDAAMNAAEVTRRFSAVGLVTMSLLIATGLANAWTLVGTIPALVGTPYGRLLLLKVGVLLPLLALAAMNLLREKPRLMHAAAAASSTEIQRRLGHLRRNVIGETVLGGIILLIVGGLGLLPPAYHAEATWPFSFRLSWEAAKALPGVRTSVGLGLQVSILGFFAVLLGVITRIRLWFYIVVPGALALIGGFVIWVPKLAVDAYPTTYLRPAVPYNALSITNGRGLYAEHCAICHGIEGYGDGPAAAGLRPRPADLTAKHTTNHTAGDIFWWLTYGIRGTAMPGFRDQLSAEERWDAINLVRALSAAEQARALTPVVEANPRIVAPDFTYLTPFGEVRALKDHRGRDLMLLVFCTLPASGARLEQLRDLYPQLRPLGAEILAIPRESSTASDEAAARPGLPFPMIAEGAAEISHTYDLFGQDLVPEGARGDPPSPFHLEFLVDRQGYLRGRWSPAEGAAWDNAAQLLSAIEWLKGEKLEAPPPDLHVH